MSRFSLELPNPFSGGDDGLFDFDPIGLLREGAQFRPPGLPRIEPGSLNFNSPFENLLSFDVPSPRDFLPFNLGDRAFSGSFGAGFDTVSNLFSHPGKLLEHGLFGGHEPLGGIVGDLFGSVKNAFNLGDLGSLGGKLSGIVGGAIDFLGPIGGIVGGLFGGRGEGVKGMIGNVASALSWTIPGLGPVVSIARMFGLDDLAGKALGGIGKAIGGLGKKIGGFFKGLF